MKTAKMKNEKKPVIVEEHEMYIRTLIAKNLRKIRNDRHVSQMDLALTADLSSNFINEIENGKKCPSLQTLAKLVKALSIEPVSLFTAEIVSKTNNEEMLKAELNSLNTAVAELNERIGRYIADNTSTSQISP